MQLDKFGIPIYNSHDLIKAIYQGCTTISSAYVEPTSEDIQKYNSYAAEFGLEPLPLHQTLNVDISEFDSIMQNQWNMPEEYKTLDIEGFLVNECPKENYQRLIEELQEFRARNMLDLLRWLKYFVDTCRANNIVWGVGRGSSVASYVLFLIGVHKIDSLKYNLDWHEFLR